MQVIQVTGGNLFQLAAKYLLDATQWERIARQNNLTDPQIKGTISLIIPDVDLRLTGGVPPQ